MNQKEYQEEISIKEYSDNVRYLADRKSTTTFKNFNSERAAIVMQNIFRISEKSLKIFTGSLNSAVSNYEGYKEELCNFIVRGGKLIIIHEEDLDTKSQTVELLKIFKEDEDKIFSDKIELYKLNKEKQAKNQKHFAIGDNSIYRFELNKKNREAVVCFNDEKTTDLLISRFDELLSVSEESSF